jgi:hypothetical protein
MMRKSRKIPVATVKQTIYKMNIAYVCIRKIAVVEFAIFIIICNQYFFGKVRLIKNLFFKILLSHFAHSYHKITMLNNIKSRR